MFPQDSGKSKSEKTQSLGFSAARQVSSQLPLVSETSSSTQNANMTYRQPALKSSITPKHQSRILALPSHPSDTSAVIVEWKPPKFLPHVQAQAKENAKLTNPMLDGMRAEHERKLEELENEKAAALKRDHQDADEVLDGLDEIFEPTLKN